MRTCLLLLVLLACPMAGRAQTVINQCMAADGHPVFTDRPCASLDATPVASSSVGTGHPAASLPEAPSTLPPPVTCAADPDTLRQAVIEAFAAHDANRLAGLMLWEGYAKHAAVADIRALEPLMDRPVVDIGLAGGGDGADATGDPDELVVATAADDASGAPRQDRFALVRDAGCLWLRRE